MLCAMAPEGPRAHSALSDVTPCLVRSSDCVLRLLRGLCRLWHLNLPWLGLSCMELAQVTLIRFRLEEPCWLGCMSYLQTRGQRRHNHVQNEHVH